MVLSHGFLGSGTILAEYEEKDFLATVTFSKITDSARPSVIEGELGSILIDKINATGEIVFVPRNGASRVVYRDSIQNNMSFEIAAFRDMTQGVISPTPYLEITEQTMRTYDKVMALLGHT